LYAYSGTTTVRAYSTRVCVLCHGSSYLVVEGSTYSTMLRFRGRLRRFCWGDDRHEFLLSCTLQNESVFQTGLASNPQPSKIGGRFHFKSRVQNLLARSTS
jgi:hypothetical protein